MPPTPTPEVASNRANIGEIAPDFSLAGSSGDIGISDYRGKKKVVLYFIREFACMTCQAHVVSLAKRVDEFESLGAQIIVIGGGRVADAEKMALRFKLPFPVLADLDKLVYESYNLEKRLLMFQKSATFLIDTSGVIRYAHRSTLPAGGLDLAALLTACTTET